MNKEKLERCKVLIDKENWFVSSTAKKFLQRILEALLDEDNCEKNISFTNKEREFLLQGLGELVAMNDDDRNSLEKLKNKFTP